MLVLVEAMNFLVAISISILSEKEKAKWYQGVYGVSVLLMYIT
jgi:hypothetical protein